MKKIIIAALATIVIVSCATPDTPKTEAAKDTVHITPADTLKYRPGSTKP